jgi:hypothetical protein
MTQKDSWDVPWQIIGRGWNGWHAAAKNVTSSGGTLEDYLAKAAEGALVYDGSEADRDAFAALVISGPMVAPELAPGTVRRFGDRETAARMAGPGGLTGAFKTLALAAQDPSYGGLDYVAPDVYVTLLRRVPGMRLGTAQAGAVVWES